MSTGQATAVASANIAFVKYWGNLDRRLRLPFNDSLSMNLSEATTTTRVRFDPDLPADTLTIDGAPAPDAARERVATHLDHLRARARIQTRARVESVNTFPMGTGIASSAAAFAALTVAAAAAAGLELPERDLSALARLGSGSAARSVPGGFVAWRAGVTAADSFAYSIAPPDHWDLRDIVAVVSRSHKAVGSTSGHDAAVTSPFLVARLSDLRARLPEMRTALLERDLARLGAALEAEALSLHAVAMTGRPPLLYWAPATIALLHQVARWRADGLPVYFTLDAGPNVHLICEGTHGAALEQALAALGYVESWLHNRPAGPARLVAAPDAPASTR
jgi:diphosphomevalonate decarboxylase